MPDGCAVDAYYLDNGQLKAKILTWGAALDELWVPDKAGNTANVVVSHPNLEHRMTHSHCQGEIAGRFCNRIKGAKFTLGGEEFNLTANQAGPTCLHGANEFNRALWIAEPLGGAAIALYYTSPAGSNGFPGELKVRVQYTLEGSAVVVDYEATSDADTVINLTNHAYFNLGGVGSGTIFGQMLHIDAPHYLPLDEYLVPTGEIRAVDGTDFDFRQPRPIRQIYDCNFCNPGTIEAWDTVTGRHLAVETDLPAVQLYTGECLDEQFTGFCLETQLWPDGPNQPAFPSCVLLAGDVWKSTTRFIFS